MGHTLTNKFTTSFFSQRYGALDIKYIQLYESKSINSFILAEHVSCNELLIIRFVNELILGKKGGSTAAGKKIELNFSLFCTLFLENPK